MNNSQQVSQIEDRLFDQETSFREYEELLHQSIDRLKAENQALKDHLTKEDIINQSLHKEVQELREKYRAYRLMVDSIRRTVNG